MISFVKRKKSQDSQEKKKFISPEFFVSFCTERLKLIYLSLKNTFVFSAAKLVVAKEV